MAFTFVPAILKTSIANGIVRCSFISTFDGNTETFLVKDFRSSQSECPIVIIYLHGSGSDESQGMTPDIYNNAFGRWAKEMTQRQAVYICPEYRGGSWMGSAAEADLMEILRFVREQFAPNKIILTGGSMGGSSALIFASRHPQELDGVVALCPASEMTEMYLSFPEQFQQSYGGAPSEVPEEYRRRSVRNNPEDLINLPIAIVHGTDDSVIPIHHSRLLVDQLRARGARIHYEELEGGDHNAPLTASLGQQLDLILE